MDEVAERQASPSRVATSEGQRPLESPTIAADGRRDRWDLADVDRCDVALLTTVKLFVDAPLPGATYDIVPPPPPLSTDPGVSLIAAGAAAKEY